MSSEDNIQITLSPATNENTNKNDETNIHPNNTVETLDLEAIVRKYVEENKPRLAILTPCYGSLCYVNYVSCLMATIQLCNSVGIPTRVEFCRNDSLVSRARNNLVAKIMNDPTMTHMLFIDSDITWDPVDVLKLIVSDKALIGGVYPIKSFEWERLLPRMVQRDANTDPQLVNPVLDWLRGKHTSELRDLVSDVDFIQQKLVRYNINHLGPSLEINQNLARVKHLATGFMMIKRSVIEKMQLAFPSTKYVDDVGFLKDDENKHAFALFDCGVEEGHYCSEDWMFCNRWTKMGGQVWIDVSINLTHTGNQDFKGSFLSSLL